LARTAIGLTAIAAAVIAALGALPSIVKPPAPAPEPGPGISFDEVSSRAGIAYTGSSFGAAWGDVNADGYPDLWASGHSPMRLYVNQGDGTFIDRTRELVGPPRYSDRHSAAWADFDNDGDEDLFQLSGADRGFGGDPKSLYVNDQGILTEEAKALGLDYPKARARGAVWLDVTDDGLLDVVVTAAKRADAPPALFLQQSGGFAVSPIPGVEESEIGQIVSFRAGSKAQVLLGLPSRLLVLEPAGASLQLVTSALGLPEHSGGWVTDALAADFDNDLAQDLVLVRGKLTGAVEQIDANSVRARLQSYHSQPQTIRLTGPQTVSVQPYPLAKEWWGKGKVFTGKGSLQPSDFPIVLTRDDPGVVGLGAGSKGLFIGFDPDLGAWQVELRDPDWSSVNLEVSAPSAITQVAAEGFSPEMEPVPQSIFWNQGGRFGGPDDVALGGRNCFAGAAGDFDNDGDLDLYLVCSGYLRNTENLVFENLGNRTFVEVPLAGGAGGSDSGIGDSVAVADYDVDGHLDLFVRNGRELMPFGSGPDQLFRNSGKANHWVQIDLIGSASNRNGIGARIVVTSGGTKQMRVIDNGTHGYVQDYRRAHFGLGAHDQVELVEVQWPSGNHTIYRDLQADQVWVLDEAGGMRQRFRDQSVQAPR
jgi:hypothetical protein